MAIKLDGTGTWTWLGVQLPLPDPLLDLLIDGSQHW
ncbi:hypothetical protein SLEP1_g56271 [Rubroshorea leprosula]|nr:hypothetical protein SLEP1_g56271 [Rubroshorea leprosula]